MYFLSQKQYFKKENEKKIWEAQTSWFFGIFAWKSTWLIKTNAN